MGGEQGRGPSGGKPTQKTLALALREEAKAHPTSQTRWTAGVMKQHAEERDRHQEAAWASWELASPVLLPSLTKHMAPSIKMQSSSIILPPAVP